MKTYLVTGAAGLIGARFVESCNRRGISVVAVDDRNYFSGGSEARSEHENVDFGTIVDREELFDWLAAAKPRLSAVVHVGACSRTTETDAAYLRRMNIEYSQKVWEYCSRERLPLLYASSAATYGAGELGYDDDENGLAKLKPLNEYGRSKAIFDVWALEQERAGKHPPAWSGFKFFNVYGYGERHKGRQASVILHAYDQILSAGRVKLFRSYRPDIPDGEQKRDFVAVEDVLEVMHFALEKPIRRGIFNLGTGRAQSFLELAHAVFRAFGQPPIVDFIDMPAEIREKYQYFTEARMERLRAEGYSRPFMGLDSGASRYVTRLMGSRKP